MAYRWDFDKPAGSAKRSRNSDQWAAADEGAGVGGDGQGSRRKSKAAPWTVEEVCALRDRLILVGHDMGPKLEEEGVGERGDEAQSSGDPPSSLISHRTPKELRRACDYLLVLWLLNASQERRSSWLPLRLHSFSPGAIAAMGEEAQPKAKKRGDAPFAISKRELVVAAGGTPRPSGRAPSNDQGVSRRYPFQ